MFKIGDSVTTLGDKSRRLIVRGLSDSGRVVTTVRPPGIPGGPDRGETFTFRADTLELFKPTMKRPRQLNALAIWSPGASNPSGIAHSIVEACAEAMEEPGHTGTAALCTDPAIRVMVYQLAALMGMEPMAFNIGEAVADCQHELDTAAA